MGKCLIDKEWWRSNSGIVSISPEASQGGIVPHVDTFLTLVRSGFTHLAFSQLETTLRKFLRTVAPGEVSNATGEFKNVYDCLLKTHLKRDSGWDNQIHVIDFFRVIRNLIHNNGCYMNRRGVDFSTRYRNVSYNFVNGSHVNNIPFGVIVDLLEDVVQVIWEIIEHPKIRNHAGEIRDPVLKSD